MQVTQEEAVAVCQEFGFATADGWDETKLVRKLGELVTLYRTGEFDPTGNEVVSTLNRLGSKENAGKEITIGSDSDVFDGEEEDEGAECVAEMKEDEEEAIKGRNPRSVGDRVLVHEKEMDEWKGIVDEILSEDTVLVRDRGSETWSVSVDDLTVKMSAAEVIKRSKKESKSEKDEKVEDSKGEVPASTKVEGGEDSEIRSLQERLKALKARQKGSGTGKKRKLGRDEIAVRVLQEHKDGGIIERLAEEVEAKWKHQGRKENFQASVSMLNRIVKAGVLFGLLQMEGKKVIWVDYSGD